MFMVAPRTAAQVGRPLPQPKARPGWSTAARGHGRCRPRHSWRWSSRSCGCAGGTGSGRCRSPAGSGIAASTVHAVLVRCRINRLAQIDRVTGEPIRRYEHEHPGSLIHVDVTKFGNIPDGGGWRYVGRQQGDRNRSRPRDRTGALKAPRPPQVGTAYLHTVIDDHSRVAYVEICADEKAETAIGVLQRAIAWFAERGVIVERVLSDNGGCYRSHAWRDACAELGITHKRPGPTGPDQRQDL